MSSRLFRSALLVCIGVLIGQYNSTTQINCSENTDVSSSNKSVHQIRRSNTLSEEEAPILLDIPKSTKEVVINVGTSIDPILPAPEMGPCAKCIAVEPIVGHNIQQHKQLSVVHAAVSEKAGVVSMNVYNNGAESSSLAKPSASQYWNANTGRGDGRTIIVPVITLTSLISAVPNSTQISLLKTDMQGFDFVAIREAGSILKKRVRHIMTEVWMNDHYTYHANNDLCRDFLPFMTQLGYDIANVKESSRSVTYKQSPEQIRAHCEKQLRDTPVRPGVIESAGLDERDAYWVRKDSIGMNFPDCPNIKKLTKTFTAEEYATCG
mmetsp:Transcript_50693/g.108019  ORF Transcript_50693/g.108019 Transcript_50693/m.108019 type:complete len:322 (+) Transcript_50693:166-1131(+)